VNLSILPIDWSALELLYVFLPFVLAGIVTFALLSVQWLAELFAKKGEGSK
jgi:hypothetical protein